MCTIWTKLRTQSHLLHFSLLGRAAGVGELWYRSCPSLIVTPCGYPKPKGKQNALLGDDNKLLARGKPTKRSQGNQLNNHFRYQNSRDIDGKKKFLRTKGQRLSKNDLTQVRHMILLSPCTITVITKQWTYFTILILMWVRMKSLTLEQNALPLIFTRFL